MEKSTCKWPGCDNPKVLARGFCQRDYLRARKLGDYDSPWVDYRPYGVPEVPPECKWPGCDLPSKYAGFCSRDYSRSKATGNRVDPWTEWDTSGQCEVCGKPWTSARNRNRRVCSKTCHMKAWVLENPERARSIKMDAVRRRRARMAGSEVEYFSIEDVRLARGDDCYLCGLPINYKLRFPHTMSPSLEHVIPISAGGAHALTNVAMAHLGCNIRKSDKPAEAEPLQTLFSI